MVLPRASPELCPGCCSRTLTRWCGTPGTPGAEAEAEAAPGGEARSPKPRCWKFPGPQQAVWVLTQCPLSAALAHSKCPGAGEAQECSPLLLPLQPVTTPGPGATAALRYFLTLNNFSRVKEKLQQQLGPTVNCERFQQIYPKLYPRVSPFSPGHHPESQWDTTPCPELLSLWSSLPHGAKDPRNPPSLCRSLLVPGGSGKGSPWHRQPQNWD